MRKKMFIITRPDIPRNLIFILAQHHDIVRKVEEADVIVVLGGDGALLHAVTKYHHLGKPFIGFHYGTSKLSVGFMMNKPEYLDEYLEGKAIDMLFRMLQVKMFDVEGNILGERYAFGDAYFKVASYMEDDFDRICFLKVSIDGTIRANPLSGDGAVVATPIGSTAYSGSAGGSVVPLDYNRATLTAICPQLYIPWHSVLLSEGEVVTLEALEFEKRPVKFMVDGQRVREVAKAEIGLSEKTITLIFTDSQDHREKELRLAFRRTL